MASIDTVEGIGPSYRDRLKECGINTVEALLEQGASKSGRTKIAADSGISEKMILDWVNRCDLMRIKGVGEEYSDLLEAAGVDTVVELATRRADNLTAKMEEVNEQKNLVRITPNQDTVADWIEQAGGMDRIVSH